MRMKEKQSAIAAVVAGTKKKPRISGDDWRRYSLLAIPFLMVLVLNYIPMVGIIIAFKEYRYSQGIFGSQWVGFKKFEFLLKSNEFALLTRNTILLNALFIVVGLLSAVIVATLLFEVKNRNATKIYQTVMITPYFVSWVIAAYMVYAFLSPKSGFVNAILQSLGFSSVDWYGEPNAWPVIFLIAHTWKFLGIDSVMYYAALMGIDTSLYEAASIDGAGKWQQFKNVTLPGLKSLTIILFIMRVGNIFRADFGLFYQLPRNSNALYSTTQVIDTYVFRVLREIGDMSLGTAAGLLQSVVGLATVLAANWICNKVEEGSGIF